MYLVLCLRSDVVCVSFVVVVGYYFLVFVFFFFFFNDTATTEIYTLSLHDALPIYVVAAILVDLVEVGRDLVARRGLPGQATKGVENVLIVNALRPVVEERVGNEVVDREVAAGAEDPQLVLLDWPAQRDGVIDDAVDGVAGAEPFRLVAIGQVARLPITGTAGDLEVAAPAVAAFARNHVEPHAARRGLSADACRL